MKDIKLGAPALISGTENSQAYLSVQTMMRCRSLTLAEGATSEGSIRTAARLLGQLREELQAKTEQKALRVGFTSKEAAFAHWGIPTDDPKTDGTMWQTGEEVVVEGLRLFVVKGKEKEAYALAHGVDAELVDDNAVTAWVGEIRYGSEADAESDGDIPVKDELVFWSCSDGKEGAMANGFPQGTVKGSYFLGSVRGALRANPQMAHADMWLALGLGNCTSDEWTEGKKLLEAKSGLKEVLDDADKAEVIAEVIATYGIEWLFKGYEEYGISIPLLAEMATKYKEAIVYQLVGGKTPIALHNNGVDIIINTDIVVASNYSFETYAKYNGLSATFFCTTNAGTSRVCHCYFYNPNRTLTFDYNGVTSAAAPTMSPTANQWNKVRGGKGYISLNDKEKTFTPSSTARTDNLQIYSRLTNERNSPTYYSYIKMWDNEGVLVAFICPVADDKFINMIDGKEYDAPSGSFTYTLE